MAERFPYGFEIEGLCHDQLIMKSRVDSRGNVTGQEHERYSSDTQSIGSGIRQFVTKIHIQYRGVRRRGLNEVKRSGDRMRGAHYFVPKLLQNIFKQHGDQGLVIKQKNARHKASTVPAKRGYSSSRLSEDAIGRRLARPSSGLARHYKCHWIASSSLLLDGLAEFFLSS
jgi:hypothetical protein